MTVRVRTGIEQLRVRLGLRLRLGGGEVGSVLVPCQAQYIVYLSSSRLGLRLRLSLELIRLRGRVVGSVLVTMPDLLHSEFIELQFRLRLRLRDRLNVRVRVGSCE